MVGTVEFRGHVSRPRPLPQQVLWAPNSTCLYVLVENPQTKEEVHGSLEIVKLTVPKLKISEEFHVADFCHWMEISLDGKKLLVCQGGTNRRALVILDAATLIPIKNDG